jgi:hypothetical protein
MIMQRYIVRASAWLEIIVGIIFITVPGVPCVLLFGAKPEGIGAPLAHWVGVGLLGLGIACLSSRAEEVPRSVVLGLVVFNAGLAILLAWVGVATSFHGVLLWPGTVLHAGITLALLPRHRAVPHVGASKGASA